MEEVTEDGLDASSDDGKSFLRALKRYHDEPEEEAEVSKSRSVTSEEVSQEETEGFEGSLYAFDSDEDDLSGEDEVRSVEANIIPALYFEDRDFNLDVMKTLHADHENWSGMPLLESVCYGFRAYQRGCFLHNHVDRTQSHIISSTICVDYSLDSPWPLYIEDIDGNPYQVDMEPGEFIYYEGAQLAHGRPYPLNGDYYVGMFVHYHPVNFDAGSRPS